jgi:hypothetical protein
MKISRFDFPNKEKTTVKRILLVVAAALMFLNTVVVPTVARADGGAGNVGSGGGKP